MTCRTIYWISYFEWKSMNKSISISNEASVYQKMIQNSKSKFHWNHKKEEKNHTRLFSLFRIISLNSTDEKNVFKFYFCRLEINSNECRGEMLPLKNVENVKRGQLLQFEWNQCFSIYLFQIIIIVVGVFFPLDSSRSKRLFHLISWKHLFDLRSCSITKHRIAWIASSCYYVYWLKFTVTFSLYVSLSPLIFSSNEKQTAKQLVAHTQSRFHFCAVLWETQCHVKIEFLAWFAENFPSKNTVRSKSKIFKYGNEINMRPS